MRRYSSLAVILAVAGFTPLSGCSGEPPSPSSPDTTATRQVDPHGFVGRASCARCHESEDEMFDGSDHDLAMEPADETTVLGDFDDATFSYYGDESTFSRRGDDFIVTTDGPDGAPHEYAVAYTFGVRPLQQYLIEMPDGRLQALSVSWDSRPEADGGQRWFHLYPDEHIEHGDELHWTALSQNWNHMCAECHSTRLRKNYDAEQDRFETTWAEIDVSCEACHGPGSRHVEWAERIEAGETAEDDASTGLVVNLRPPDESYWVFDEDAPTARRTAPLEPNVQVESCGRCHSRRGQIWEDYRYGHPLGDTHRVALLDERLYHADGQILDEVYVYGSFVQSPMYHAGVTCTDCHEAHSNRLLAEGNAVCARCHQPAVFDVPEHHHHEPGTPGSQCVECHMPVRDYMVVDPRHDHSMRVPRPDLSVTLGTPNTCNDCHADKSPHWASEAVEEWYGPERSERFHYGEALHAGRAGLVSGGALLLQVAEDPEMPAIARATALDLLRRDPSPETARAIERGARDADPLVRRTAAEMLDLFEPAARVELGFDLLSDPVRTVRLAAVFAAAGVPSDLLTVEQRATLNRAVDEYRASQAFSADRPEAHLNLGNLERLLGRPDAAEQAFRTAIGKQREFIPAYVNLADLLRAEGRDDESERVLRDGLAAAGDNAALRYALGLSLVRLRRTDESLEHLAAAAELRPENARYAFVYAIALHDLGSPDAALAVLQKAHESAAPNRDVLFALVNFNMERGRRDMALRWAREMASIWPDDPAVLQMLQALQ